MSDGVSAGMDRPRERKPSLAQRHENNQSMEPYPVPAIRRLSVHVLPVMFEGGYITV